MPMYENARDRARQEVVRARLEEHLQSLPIGRVEIKHTPESMRASHDLDVYVSGMYVAVVEVKSRNYTAEWFQQNGWFFENDRLRALKKQFYLPNHGWTKDVSLALLTSDDNVFMVKLDELAKHYRKLRVITAGTDDHGAAPNGRDGVVIPVELLKCV